METNEPAVQGDTEQSSLAGLEQEADRILEGIFEDDDVSREFTEQLKAVIMTYLDTDSLIQVNVENRDDDAISCSVVSDDGVHKFIYESEEEWGGMFFGRDEVEDAFYALNELERDPEVVIETPLQH